jgi:hypothetical protein
MTSVAMFRSMTVRSAAVSVLVVGLSAPVWAAPQQAGDSTADSSLSSARRLYEATEYEGALSALDRVVALIDPRVPLSPARLELLAGAYELRARARFGLNDSDGARNDFRSLLRIDPGHRLPVDVSPRVVILFNDIKKALVGALNLVVAPSDAEVQLDDATTRAGGSIFVTAGQHVVMARRAGYAPASETISVPADGVTDLTLALRRVAGVATIVTVPPDVDVLLDGNPRGRTEGLASAAESKPFLLTDIVPGIHVVRAQKACYIPSERRLEFQAADYQLEPVKLARAVGTMSVTSAAAGTVFLDGQSRGSLPMTSDEVCEGPHVVEVRSAVGRYIRRFDMRVGGKVAVTADVRPAIALLSVTGLPEGLRGGPDLRLKTEEIFQASKTITLFAAPADEVEQLLRREQLRPGWLSFDTARRPLADDAANITALARQELSGKLAKALDVQGVAVVTAPSKSDTYDVLLTILAAGSGQPDTVQIKLDDPDSILRALSTIDATPQLFRLSAGMQAADILDVGGAVVVSTVSGGAAERAGITPGDVILRANGQPVADASGLLKVLEGPAGDVFSLELRDRSGLAKRADLRLVNVPQAVATVDRTLLSNKLLLDFRRRLNAAADASEESVTRLNLAIALMRVGNWVEARGELEKVRLPDGPGVSNGTVLYLLGLCRVALGQLTDAEAAFRGAASAKDGLLTAEGPPIKALAERELADLVRRSSRPSDR